MSDLVRTPLSEAPPAITSFSRQYRYLSSPYPCPVWFENIRYPSAEHAFQAAKTLSGSLRVQIAGQPDWREAKRMGRAISLRPGWDRLRRAVMLQVVLAKFTQNPDLAAALVQTGQRPLLEGNWWGDTDWGVVREDHRAWSPDLPWWHEGGWAWSGHNWLGLALMAARDVLTPVPGPQDGG